MDQISKLKQLLFNADWRLGKKVSYSSAAEWIHLALSGAQPGVLSSAGPRCICSDTHRQSVWTVLHRHILGTRGYVRDTILIFE